MESKKHPTQPIKLLGADDFGQKVNVILSAMLKRFTGQLEDFLPCNKPLYGVKHGCHVGLRVARYERLSALDRKPYVMIIFCSHFPVAV